MYDRQKLLALLRIIMNPGDYNLSEADGDEVLIRFCVGCPDPIGASWLVVECLDPMSDEELVDRALAMPPRNMAQVPVTELPAGHPLRKSAQELEASSGAGEIGSGA
jgi:hypothetical protein